MWRYAAHLHSSSLATQLAVVQTYMMQVIDETAQGTKLRKQKNKCISCH